MHSVAGVNNDGIDARSVTRLAAALGLGLLLAACGSQPPRPIAEREGSSVAPTAVQSTPPAQKPPYVLKRGGGFYRDDGPGDNPP